MIGFLQQIDFRSHKKIYLIKFTLKTSKSSKKTSKSIKIDFRTKGFATS